MGDFNVNLINYHKNRGTYQFLEQLLYHNFTARIMLTTRITDKTATLIHNIFVNDQAQKNNSGNITTSTSDHLLQFIIIENGKGDKQDNKTAKITYRDYKNFNMDSFKIDLQGIDGTFATHNNDVNLGFEACLGLFNTTLDKHAPIKEFTKKKKKKKINYNHGLPKE